MTGNLFVRQYAYEYNAQGQFQITNGGGTVEIVTQIDNNILYTGRSYDFETGNYFYRARYYSPDLGRFISRDPLSGAEFSQGTYSAYTPSIEISSIRKIAQGCT